jgi:hypothetical protein
MEAASVSGAASGLRKGSRSRIGRGRWQWEYAVAAVAIVSAVAAFWVTIDAKFPQYPDWLAVQKADLILGPVFVGLYWHYRRRQVAGIHERSLPLPVCTLGWLLSLEPSVRYAAGVLAFGLAHQHASESLVGSDRQVRPA